MWTPMESVGLEWIVSAPDLLAWCRYGTYAHGMAVDGKQNRADREQVLS